jgi:hypothetical protein
MGDADGLLVAGSEDEGDDRPLHFEAVSLFQQLADDAGPAIGDAQDQGASVAAERVLGTDAEDDERGDARGEAGSSGHKDGSDAVLDALLGAESPSSPPRGAANGQMRQVTCTRGQRSWR